MHASSQLHALCGLQATLFTPIYGQRERAVAAGGPPSHDYWITDGLYGSFNCILYDGALLICL